MKRWISVFIAAVMIFAAAQAEDMEPVLNGAQVLALDEICEIDLDGDGLEEIVRPQMEGFAEEQFLQLLVETEEEIFFYDTFILYMDGTYITDLDGDGLPEVLLSGDEISSDYFTWCVKFSREEGFHAIPFADANRGENTDKYFDGGYGRIVEIDGNKLTMMGSQDALGTWWCTREFTLRDGRFELDDDGLWHVVLDADNPDTWEYSCLELIRDLEITREDGSKATLSAGEKMIPTETDKVSFVNIRTQSGERGTIHIEPDVEEGWGFMIDGINEYEYFDYIPYAD